MFQNHWRNCEFCKPISTINSSAFFELCLFLTVRSTSGRLNSCAWLLLFEVLCVIISLLSFGICCTTLSVDSVIVNYLCWSCLFIQIFLLLIIFPSFKGLFIDNHLYELRRSQQCIFYKPSKPGMELWHNLYQFSDVGLVSLSQIQKLLNRCQVNLALFYVIIP